MNKEEKEKVHSPKIDMREMVRQIYALVKRSQENFDSSNYGENDIRKDIFTYMKSELQFLMLGIMLSKELTSYECFWSKWRNSPSQEENVKNHQGDFLNSLFNSFYFLFFVQVENYLRLIANDINKEKFSIMKTFKNLAKEYYLSKEDENLFSIFSELRNLSHNGGFYNKENKSIEFKGRIFNFKKGKGTILPFSVIENNIFIAEHIIDLIEKINQKTEKIDYIENNYAKIEFTYE
ncbi:hypothetical protein ACSQ7D_08375 [Capnocytophaga sp. G1920]|uniref:hypothetical protein n=1 Tax=Capnocytophaga sp. G1920 TaxID=3448875 RepID=UPI003EDC8A62